MIVSESLKTILVCQGCGRSQELALAAVDELAGLDNLMLITLATDAAGVVVTGETEQRARALGLAPEAFLERTRGVSFFRAARRPA